MGRILLAWELGDGLGHVSRLLPIATALNALGHECLLAVRDLVSGFPLTRDQNLWLFQSPYVQVPTPVGPVQTGSFSDILAVAGFTDQVRLAATVQAWSDLIAFARPDLVIADFSPALCLALYGSATPLIVIGDGFTLPPDREGSFPAFPGLQPTRPEEEVLATFQAVQQERRRPIPPYLGALFPKSTSYVVTLPELDPYASERGGEAIGALERHVPAAATPSQDWFAYLSLDDPRAKVAIDALSAHDSVGSLHLRNATSAEIKALRDRGLTVHDTPQDLGGAIGGSKIVIHHGGLGVAQAALSIGRPQLLLPRQLEQRLNAHSLGVLGVALGMGRKFTGEDFVTALTRAVDDADLHARARQRAEVIEKRNAGSALDVIVAACQARLGAPATPFLPLGS